MIQILFSHLLLGHSFIQLPVLIILVSLASHSWIFSLSLSLTQTDIHTHTSIFHPPLPICRLHFLIYIPCSLFLLIFLLKAWHLKRYGRVKEALMHSSAERYKTTRSGRISTICIWKFIKKHYKDPLQNYCLKCMQWVNHIFNYICDFINYKSHIRNCYQYWEIYNLLINIRTAVGEIANKLH